MRTGLASSHTIYLAAFRLPWWNYRRGNSFNRRGEHLGGLLKRKVLHINLLDFASSRHSRWPQCWNFYIALRKAVMASSFVYFPSLPPSSSYLSGSIRSLFVLQSQLSRLALQVWVGRLLTCQSFTPSLSACTSRMRRTHLQFYLASI